jgi:hypothetical protein
MFSKNTLYRALNELARRSDLFGKLKDNLAIRLWLKAGKPVPPPQVVKRRIVSSYASEFRPTTFIETGTYLGDMDYAVKGMFQAIFSIELSEDLWRRAANRFRANSHIQILQGDSGQLLPQVLSSISNNCLFWLDGHYSGGITAKGNSETPVVKELEAIFVHKAQGHVILIDDARCFNGTHDYPTLDRLQELVALNRPDYAFSVLNDVIRIHPRRKVQCEF